MQNLLLTYNILAMLKVDPSSQKSKQVLRKELVRRRILTTYDEDVELPAKSLTIDKLLKALLDRNNRPPGNEREAVLTFYEDFIQSCRLVSRDGWSAFAENKSTRSQILRNVCPHPLGTTTLVKWHLWILTMIKLRDPFLPLNLVDINNF